jgi:hypothetical protein
MFKLIDHWKTVLRRSAVTWITAIITFLVGALGQTYLAAFAFLGFVSDPTIQFVGAGFLAVIVIGGPIILARLVEQPALNAKLEEKNNAGAIGNSSST